MKKVLLIITMTVSCVAGLTAQTVPAWDTSGNNLLNGSYNFRHVVYDTATVRGKISRKFLLYGTIQFDGRGTYSITGTHVDTASNNGAPRPASLHGTYGLAASGLGSMTDPVSAEKTIYGLVANGIFVGGSTESAFHDLFVAAPVSLANESFFTGAYHVVGIDVPTDNPNDLRDFWFPATTDGRGSLSSISVSGYVAGGIATPITQSLPPAPYFVSGSRGTIEFVQPSSASPNFLSGRQTFYVSPDGSFIFGGSPNSFNIFVGVRSPTGSFAASDFGGLYYQAGIDHDTSQITTGLTGLSNYYGSLKAVNGIAINHQRINALVFPSPLDYTFSDYYTVRADGTSGDSFQNYWLNERGTIRLGIGLKPFLGISIAIKAPSFSGQGVFINPTGVTNAASSAPFTAPVSPGGFVTIYGTDLAPSALLNYSSVAPKQLNGVQVLVNGVASPITYVSPTQISFLAPFSTRSIAAIQVINNGWASNIVTAYVSATSPGLLTVSIEGIPVAVAIKTNNTLVSKSNPAMAGETVQFFASGLGTVSPSIQDGVPGPINPLSHTNERIRAYIDGRAAEVTYSGLAPHLLGVYQLNIVIPRETRSGNVFVDISGSDSDTSQGSIAIGATADRSISELSSQLSAQRRKLPPSENSVSIR